jgi:hypothetical protein
VGRPAAPLVDQPTQFVQDTLPIRPVRGDAANGRSRPAQPTPFIVRAVNQGDQLQIVGGVQRQQLADQPPSTRSGQLARADDAQAVPGEVDGRRHHRDALRNRRAVAHDGQLGILFGEAQPDHQVLRVRRSTLPEPAIRYPNCLEDRGRVREPASSAVCLLVEQ